MEQQTAETVPKANDPRCFGCGNWYQSANCSGSSLHKAGETKTIICGLPKDVLGEKPISITVGAEVWDTAVCVKATLEIPVVGRLLAARAIKKVSLRKSS